MATSNYNDEFKKYQQLLKSNQANLKAELGSIRQKSMATAENYLKQLGLQGSGAGQSVYAQLGSEYSNALANLNAQTQQAEQAYKDQYTSNITSAYKNLLESGASYSEAKDFQNKYLNNNQGLNIGTSSYLDALRTASGATWQNDRTLNIETIDERLTDKNLKDYEINTLNDIKTALNNAITEEEYDSLLRQYQRIISGQEAITGEPTEEDIKEDLYAKLEGTLKTGKSNSILNQPKYNQKLIESDGKYYYSINGKYISLTDEEAKTLRNNGFKPVKLLETKLFE